MDKSTRRRWAMAATATSLLVVGLDMTVLNVALPDIAVDLSASSAQLQWFANSYLLVLSVLLLPAGMLGDRYGRKRLTVGALIVFGAGSAWCAWADSPASLIAARTVLGVGAAVIVPLAMSSVVVLFEPEERAKGFLVLGAATMIGLPLGPIVGGLLLQHFWWGSVFVLNLPVIAVSLAAVIVFLPESTSPDRRRPFDILGVTLSGAGLLGLTFGTIEGPEWGWTDPVVLTSLVGGILLLVMFFRLERRDRRVEPVFDFGVWADPAFRWGSVGAALSSVAFFGVMFAVPQYLRAVLGADALGTGLRLLPMVVGLIVGLRITMMLLPKVGAKTLGATGFGVAAAALLLGTSVDLGDGFAVTATWTAVVGAGIGAALFATQNTALSALPRARAASGSALIQTLRQVGSVMGIATLGALLNSVYRDRVSVAGLPSAAADVVRENVASGVVVGQRLGATALVDSVRSAFLDGMAATLWVSAGIAVVGAVVVLLFLPDGRELADAASVTPTDDVDAAESVRAPRPEDAESQPAR